MYIYVDTSEKQWYSQNLWAILEFFIIIVVVSMTSFYCDI